MPISRLPLPPSTGRFWIKRVFAPWRAAAIAAGADGLIIEVHNDPKKALCDGAQSLDFPMFKKLMHKVNVLKECMDGLKD